MIPVTPASLGQSFYDFLTSKAKPSREERRRIALEAEVSRDVAALIERVRDRKYQATLHVLAYYWLQTLRERYTGESWTLLRKRLRGLCQEPADLTELELDVLRYATDWAEKTEPSEIRDIRRHNLAPLFSSEQFAPPQFVTQRYLETLLTEWLPQRVLEKYGTRHLSADWTENDALEEIALCLEDILRPLAFFPDIADIRAYDRIQRRPQTQPELVEYWRRRRQAALEAMVRVPPRDASAVDPKEREVLCDVILYLLGATETPTPAESGYAWLFATPAGRHLPADFGQQVSEFPLPAAYVSLTSLLIPIRNFPGALERRPALSIESSILTPDGRVWEAQDLELTADAAPSIRYDAVGRVDMSQTPEGLFLWVPARTWPRELSPGLNRETEFMLYHHRWHLVRIEAVADPGWYLFKALTPSAIPIRPTVADGPRLGPPGGQMPGGGQSNWSVAARNSVAP